MQAIAKYSYSKWYIAAMSSPSLRSLAAVFVRHGNTTFGGGSATIATLHGQIVTKREWVSQQQFDLSYALSRLTPGTNLLAFSTAIGWLVRGWPGALVVLLASSIPCSVLAVLLSMVYQSLTHHPFALVALRGALAAARHRRSNGMDSHPPSHQGGPHPEHCSFF